MKKFLAILLATFAMTASAKETITVTYSWLPSDPAANMYRQLVEESNRIQDKYTFLFDTKPGAGGSIAARFVQDNPNVILANSSALFIRPIFFPEGSHDVTNFKSLMPMCNAPMLITSGKYKSWAEVPTDKPLTIGHSGNGTTTHLVATQIAAKYPMMTIVAFKGTSEALISTVAGNTDFAVNFLGESKGFLTPVNGRQVYILGTTGRTPVAGAKPLYTQGFTESFATMSSPQQLFVNQKFPDAKFKEVRSIFLKAAKSKGVEETFDFDHCQANNQLPEAELEHWFNSQLIQWRKIAGPVAATQPK